MSVEGFYTEEYVYNRKQNAWIPTGKYYLNWLVVAGTVVLLVYFVPFIYRPLDFAKNFLKYIIGFICYMMMLPVFSNVFQIYAMSNLHDISWGNRPASTG